MRQESQGKIERCGRCGHVLDVDDICQPCRAARTARSALWYGENATEASARRTARNRVTRRFTGAEMEAIRQCLVAEQRGVCGCCGGDGGTVGLSVEWSLDATTDDDVPLLRAAICRRCKIAVNRYIRPSKFTLVPSMLTLVEAYDKRRWVDPRDVLRRMGLEHRRVRVEASARSVVSDVDARLTSTDDVARWLESIGAG